MLPALLLGLATMLAVPLFPGDTPEQRLPATSAPVLVSISSAVSGSATSVDVADATERLVERIEEHLQARSLNMTFVGLSDFTVSPTPTGSSPTGRIAASTSPQGVVKLSIGFNSSPMAAASGVETRFGGNGDLGWRLASEIQRNVVGGLRDVLGYDVYDRGVQEVNTPPEETNPVGAADGDAWVSVYPLFASNSFEASLISTPGSLEVLAAAISNAIADYLDPSVPTPSRTAQADLVQAPSWQPVSPWAIYRAEHSDKVALTFDGGASSAPTPAILKALKDAGIHATMFMTGDFVRRNPDLVVQMARDGHEFGNHSSTHPDMTKLSDEQIVQELNGLDASVQALTGKSTRPWFRPPFGAVNDRVLRVAASQGYYAVMWTADSADWRSSIEPSTVASRILRYAQPGAIMIEHLGSPQSAQVLPDVLKTLKDQGLSFGTLSEVIWGR